MKKFNTYLLENTITEQHVYLPEGAEVVGVITNDSVVNLLAIVPNSSLGAPALRRFKICMTDEIFIGSTVKYIGSFKSDLGFKHVIELL